LIFPTVDPTIDNKKNEASATAAEGLTNGSASCRCPHEESIGIVPMKSAKNDEEPLLRMKKKTVTVSKTARETNEDHIEATRRRRTREDCTRTKTA